MAETAAEGGDERMRDEHQPTLVANSSRGVARRHPGSHALLDEEPDEVPVTRGDFLSDDHAHVAHLTETQRARDPNTASEATG